MFIVMTFNKFIVIVNYYLFVRIAKRKTFWEIFYEAEKVTIPKILSIIVGSIIFSQLNLYLISIISPQCLSFKTKVIVIEDNISPQLVFVINTCHLLCKFKP